MFQHSRGASRDELYSKQSTFNHLLLENYFWWFSSTNTLYVSYVSCYFHASHDNVILLIFTLGLGNKWQPLKVKRLLRTLIKLMAISRNRARKRLQLMTGTISRDVSPGHKSKWTSLGKEFHFCRRPFENYVARWRRSIIHHKEYSYLTILWPFPYVWRHK